MYLVSCFVWDPDNIFCFPTQAFDQHLNMVLGDVEETHTVVEVDEETFEEIIKVRFGTNNFFVQSQLFAFLSSGLTGLFSARPCSP
jgi:hypothetical protein